MVSARRGAEDHRGGPAALPVIAAGCLAIGVVSLLVPASPSYDPWSWLLWGREVTRLDLSTVDGPAFKPLPVALTTLLAPFGDAAPELWLAVARGGAAAAIVLAFVVARDLAGGSTWAGVAAGAGVLLTSGFVLRAATGESEPLMLALALAAFAAARAHRHGLALGLAAAAALVRVEVWPFLGLYGLWCAWRHPRLRPALAAAAVLVPAAWFVPEYLGSGELLRSSDRAQIPNPGQPALADFPAGESLRRAAGLIFVPVALGIVALRPRAAAALPAVGGLAWMLLVAVMAQAGFSGEERYAMPGAALVAVSGGAGLALLRGRAVLAVFAAVVAVLGGLRVAHLAEGVRTLPRGERLVELLPEAIDAAGGRERLLACGRPAVGRFRGPLLAYHLDVHKRVVRADGLPGAVTFRSALRGEPLSPAAVAGARTLASNPRWRVEARCDGRSDG